MANPFNPTFGKQPPLLVGRGDVLAEFGEAIKGGTGPMLASLVSGSRGSGKTVLLNALEDRAREHGWLVFSETAATGLVDRLVNERLGPALRHLEGDDPVALRSISAVGFSASWDRPTTGSAGQFRPGLRTVVEALTDRLVETGTGVLITVDEVHAGDIEELRAVAIMVQHAFREERPVAFVAAGLPTGIASMYNDKVLTFLRRAHRIDVGLVSGADAAMGLAVPLSNEGREISEAALRVAVEATQGYPFLIQLVGHELYRATSERIIDVEAAERAIPLAHRRLGQLVHEPVLADLSPRARDFLLAMARDDGPSRIRDVADRMGVEGNYAAVYRTRLIQADLVEPAGHGLIDYRVPYLRGYLQGLASTGLGIESADHDSSRLEIDPPSGPPPER